MSPPIATAVSNSNLELITTKKYCPNNSNNLFANNFNPTKVLNGKKSNSPSNFLCSKGSTNGSSSTLFDILTCDKSHDSDTIVDFYKLYDYSFMDYAKPFDFDSSRCESSEKFIENIQNLEIDFFNIKDESTRNLFKSTTTTTNYYNNEIQNEIEYSIDYIELQRALKSEKQDNSRNLKDNNNNSIVCTSPSKDKDCSSNNKNNNNNNDSLMNGGHTSSSNSSNFYFCDVSKKSNNSLETQIISKTSGGTTTAVVKPKIKFKADNNINRCKVGTKQQQQSVTTLSDGKTIDSAAAASCLNPTKQNILSNTYYCKSDNQIAMRTSILKSSFTENDSLLQLNCINPNQIFPYNFTLKRIKTELSDSEEEEIDVVSVNLSKNPTFSNNITHNFNNSNKICIQQDTSNNMFLLKKNASLKNNSQSSSSNHQATMQSSCETTEAQMIKNELLNGGDKCSLLADILKTPLSYSSKVQAATKREPAITTTTTTTIIAHDAANTNILTTNVASNIKKTVSPAVVSSTISNSNNNNNKMKYPIQIYPSIKDSSKELVKNKFILTNSNNNNNNNNKPLKQNLVNLNNHKRSIKSNSIAGNASMCSKKNFINNVINKAAANKRSNNMARSQTSLIITQRAVKVATAESIKSMWKNKRLKRKMADTKVGGVGKKNSSLFSIADSEESSNEDEDDDDDDDDDSDSSSLSNFSTHSSGWSSPLEYSSSSESLDNKSTNIMTTFDLNVLNEKLCKKVGSEKMEVSDWTIYSNMSDYGYSDTCSSLCSEQINSSNNLNTSNSISNNSGALSYQSSSSPLKRNRSYTSGYSSDNPAEKRAFHILSERQRRNDLKKLFETLRTNVPNLSDKQKASKLTILKAAVDFLADVSSKQIKLSVAYEKEKQRHLQLIQNLKVLQANLK